MDLNVNAIDIRANFARLENGFSQQYEIMNVAGTKFDLIGGMRGSLRNVFFVRQIQKLEEDFLLK